MVPEAPAHSSKTSPLIHVIPTSVHHQLIPPKHPVCAYEVGLGFICRAVSRGVPLCVGGKRNLFATNAGAYA